MLNQVSDTPVVGATSTALVDEFNTDYGTTLDFDSTVNARNAAYAVERAAAEAVVLGEEDDVATAQAAVDALDADAEIAAYEAAKAADDAADDAVLEALSDLNGAIAAYETLMTGADPVLTVAADGTAVFNPDDAGVGVDVDLIVINTDGDLELGTDVTEADYPGVTALLAASIAKEAADAVKVDTAADLVTATSDLDDVDTVANGTELGLVTALATQQEQLAAAQEAAADLETAIAAVEAAYALNDELDALNEDITDAATAAANDGEYTIVVIDGAELDSAAKDVYIYDEAAGSIAGFEAGDVIAFGTGYTLVTLADDEVIADNLGSSSALEIFYDASLSTLYVETETFGGNSASTTEVVQIVLTGVTADLELTSSGYLQLA